MLTGTYLIWNKILFKIRTATTSMRCSGIVLFKLAKFVVLSRKFVSPSVGRSGIIPSLKGALFHTLAAAVPCPLSHFTDRHCRDNFSPDKTDFPQTDLFALRLSLVCSSQPVRTVTSHFIFVFLRNNVPSSPPRNRPLWWVPYPALIRNSLSSPHSPFTSLTIARIVKGKW